MKLNSVIDEKKLKILLFGNLSKMSLLKNDVISNPKLPIPAISNIPIKKVKKK